MRGSSQQARIKDGMKKQVVALRLITFSCVLVGGAGTEDLKGKDRKKITEPKTDASMPTSERASSHHHHATTVSWVVVGSRDSILEDELGDGTTCSTKI